MRLDLIHRGIYYQEQENSMHTLQSFILYTQKVERLGHGRFPGGSQSLNFHPCKPFHGHAKF